MYLIDTNIFLEILLNQEKKEICKNFLNKYVGHLQLSDFSLHSIGVILFKLHHEDAFKAFIRDMLPSIEIATLSKASYEKLPDEAARLGLDFDDAYQFLVAKERGIVIITMDRDFKRIENEHLVTFL